MTFIPDQISAETLASLHKEAEVTAKIKEVVENSIDTKVPDTDMTEREFCHHYGKKIDDLVEEIGSSFGYKFLADYSLFCLLQFHEGGAKEQLSRGEVESSAGWQRDAGMIQAMASLIRKIYMGPQDFICDPDCNPELVDNEDDDTETV